METLHTWWATELYPMRERDQFGVSGEFEVVLAADAQATIAALQARVQELEESRDAWKASQECSEKAYMALVNQIPAERFDYDPINVALLDGAKEQEIIGRKQIADLQSHLTQRTAELEAAKTEYLAVIEAQSKEIDDLQAELERVRALIKALPKVEGEITYSQQIDSAWRLQYWQVEAYGVADECIYRLSNLREAEAKAYAALLKHRQGMEG